MKIVVNVACIFQPLMKGLEVVLANGMNFVFDMTNLSGIERLVYLFRQYRYWQDQGIGKEWDKKELAPTTEEELLKSYKMNCMTYLEDEARKSLWEGIHRYCGATNSPAPQFGEAKGTYAYIYKHPSEPRFAAIKAEKAWQALCQKKFPNFFGLAGESADTSMLNLKDVLLDLNDYGIGWTLGFSYFKLPGETLRDRQFQQANGCLLKTGKVIQHLLKTDGVDVSTLAGYVQDALRLTTVSTDTVKVSEDVGKIYRMGGNFVSCMRSLGWDDDRTGKDSYQIYKDLGAKVAYITTPEKDSLGNFCLNPETGEIVTRLTARAILWDHVILIKDGEVYKEVKLMDTIYRDGSNEQATMVKWARQNGYAYKKTECSYSESEFTYGPDRADENFDLDDFDDARVYRIDDLVWDRGIYHRVPWIDLFAGISRGTNYAGYRRGDTYLHNQSGKGGFLTDIIKCQFCDTELTSADEEEDWRERNGRWTCPSCYDTEWVICEGENCDEEGPAADFEQIEEHWYCSSCAENLFANCDACGTRLKRDDDYTYYNNNGTPFCEECYHERYSYCTHCDEETYRDDLVYIDDQTGDVCRWCAEEYYRECDNCGNMIDRDEVQSCYMTTNHKGRIYTGRDDLCESCREEINTQECPECGDLWDNMFPESVALGQPMCRDCFLERFRKCEFANCWCEREEAQRNISCKECRKAMHDMSE